MVQWRRSSVKAGDEAVVTRVDLRLREVSGNTDCVRGKDIPIYQERQGKRRETVPALPPSAQAQEAICRSGGLAHTQQGQHTRTSAGSREQIGIWAL